MNPDTQEVKILLVEDNPTDAELTIDALRDCHLVSQLHWIKDGAEALDFLFQRGTYANHLHPGLKLALLDLRLPHVDGIDVLRALRANELTRRLPVVVLTSSHEEIDIVRTYDLGTNSYVVKPVESDSLFKAVRDLGLYWMLLNKCVNPARRIL